MTKILVVEDDANIRELVVYNLKSEGYDCIELSDGGAALETVEKERPNLVLLDIMLPVKDGFEVCKLLRAKGFSVPIIMLTAKNDEVDKVLGLEFGADDYLTKPFSVRELKARIKAVLRRYETDSNSNVMEVDELKVNLPNHEVWLSDNQISLTLKEFDLLVKLMENRGRVFTRNQLLDSVWGYEYSGETRTVDVHIRSLRKKLGDDEDSSRYVQTVRGVGYKMPLSE